MLTTFEQIRGLVFLMSWDQFEDDVLARIKLANVMWDSKERSTGNLPLVSNADQVAFQVKQTWWVVSNLYPELVGMFCRLLFEFYS